MVKEYRRKIIDILIIVLGGIPSIGMASDFNIPFINASGLGNMYSGWTVSAEDASTAYANPAGLTQLSHPQLVAAGVGLMGSTQFTGTTTPPSATQTGSASSQLRALLPSFYYARPISDKVVIAFSETVPFGLGTNYSKQSIVRYAATRSQIAVVDIGPSIGIKVNDKLAVGAGLDIQHLAFTLNSMFGTPISNPDSEGQNHLRGWGYGMHAGLLFQATDTTRVGFNYNTQTVFHTTGDSEFFYNPTHTEFRTTQQKSNLILPALAQLSLQKDINKQWTVMGTVFYSRWSVLQQLTLQNTMQASGTASSVSIPFNYHDTFDYSLGATFKATEKWLLRAGVQFLGSPTNNRNRSVSDPLNEATIVSLGTRYQQNKNLSYDFGYAHGFFHQSAINNITPLTTTVGHSNSYTNILGAQVNWDFA